MTLDEVKQAIEATSAYPLLGLRLEDDHVFAVLGRKMADDKIIEYTFAMSRAQLRQANDPNGIVTDHVRIATADLDMLKEGDGPLPMLGP